MSQSNTPADPGAESSVDTGHLFDEFQAVSREAWEQKIRKDLKLETDAGYEKRILWRTAEGFVIQPFYDAADLNGLESPDAEPGRFPFLRGRSGADNRWEIREEIYDADPAVANRRALAALEAGVDSVCFVIAAEGGRMRGVDLTGDVAAAFQTLLAGVWLDAAPIHFRAGAAAPLIVALLHAEVQRQKLDPRADFWNRRLRSDARVGRSGRTGYRRGLRHGRRPDSIHPGKSAGPSPPRRIRSRAAQRRSGNRRIPRAVAGGRQRNAGRAQPCPRRGRSPPRPRPACWKSVAR
jgi:hypothetical protein